MQDHRSKSGRTRKAAGRASKTATTGTGRALSGYLRFATHKRAGSRDQRRATRLSAGDAARGPHLRWLFGNGRQIGTWLGLSTRSARMGKIRNVRHATHGQGLDRARIPCPRSCPVGGSGTNGPALSVEGKPDRCRVQGIVE